MGSVAFVFSGQGAQYTGMGKDLYDNNPAAKAVFDRLEAIRPGTLAQCFEADIQELSQTVNTQPCMFAVELAAAAALTETGVRCGRTAGFSLGEIAALTFSGAVDLETGFRLVCRRGELMQAAAQAVDSGMAAVVKLTDEQVKELCAGFEHVYPVNYNCPGQVAVAGLTVELKEFTAAVKQAGGRAIPLKVRGGFHSPFMDGAARAFAAELQDIAFAAPEIPLYSDYTAEPYAGDFAELLSKQICNPVQWTGIVRHMIAAGTDTFLELGPGKTLCGLIAKIDPSVRVLHVENCESLRQAVEESLC